MISTAGHCKEIHMMNRREIGMAAEKTACRFLELQGYEILERNFAAKTGEIDIIARQGGFLVFVEVKVPPECSLRISGRGGRCEEADETPPDGCRIFKEERNFFQPADAF